MCLDPDYCRWGLYLLFIIAGAILSGVIVNAVRVPHIRQEKGTIHKRLIYCWLRVSRCIFFYQTDRQSNHSL